MYLLDRLNIVEAIDSFMTVMHAALHCSSSSFMAGETQLCSHNMHVADGRLDDGGLEGVGNQADNQVVFATSPLSALSSATSMEIGLACWTPADRFLTKSSVLQLGASHAVNRHP